MHGSSRKIPNKKSRPHIYDVKFLALLGAPYIYDISKLRVNSSFECKNGHCNSVFTLAAVRVYLQLGNRKIPVSGISSRILPRLYCFKRHDEKREE
jgi:hypothetical protein